MLKFKKLLKKDIKKITEYLKENKEGICDYSQGVIFMWYDHFKYQYAICNDMLILKVGDKNSPTFFPPVGKGDSYKAVSEVENYCIENEFPIRFSFLGDETTNLLLSRYNGYDVSTGYNRNFSDYIYNYDDVKYFKGKKYNGQRNHINGFKKLYPNYTYNKITKKSIPLILEFLTEYESQHKNMKGIEEKEYLNTVELVKNLNVGEFVGGYLEVDGKIVAISVGEYIGNTLIIHIEKALVEYKGVYPTMFNEFVKHCEKEGVIYVNREDDSGDLGLRTSKTQYRPCKLLNKHYVRLTSFMTDIKKPTLKGEKVTLSPIKKSDELNYYKLNVAVKNNKMWGYNYKKDNKHPSVSYFYKVQAADYKSKLNLCLAIREKNKEPLIGEVILYKFDFNGYVEMGIRLFKKHQQKGYAKESVNLISNYVTNTLGLKLKAKCYILNENSKKLFTGCGFEEVFKDNKFYYFIKK